MVIKTRDNSQKRCEIELILFVCCVFFQNFAIIRTNNFGISCLTVFLIYAFVRYKYFLRFTKKTIAFLGVTLIVSLAGFVFNDVFNYMQLFRLLMIFFVIYTGYHYIKDTFMNGKNEKLLKYTMIISVIICIYGIYQYVASMCGWPIFLNIFNNNPSYAVRGIFEIYGGWNNGNRIYATFFEPSVYALFLVSLFFIFLLYKKKRNGLYYIAMLLILINIILTFSRVGFISFFCYMLMYIYSKYVDKKIKWSAIVNKILTPLIVLLPFVMLIIMHFVGMRFFTDSSMILRTNSALFYLANSFENIKYILVGHGLGTLSDAMPKTNEKMQIEPFAHNGYIELIYVFGLAYFLFLIYFIYKTLLRGLEKNKLIVYISVSLLCCFGTLYNVESLAVIVLIMICFSKFSERKENDFNNICE